MTNREATAMARAIVLERLARAGKYPTTSHPLPQIALLMETHNRNVEVIDALSLYIESLEIRILELEGKS